MGIGDPDFEFEGRTNNAETLRFFLEILFASLDVLFDVLENAGFHVLRVSGVDAFN